MSAPSTTPISAHTIPRIWRSESRTYHIPRESVATHSLNNLGSEWESELDCDSIFNGPSSTVSHTYSCPETPCFPRMFYYSPIRSAASSYRVPTPPSSLDSRPQTPPSPRTTSFLATPSPLCLGPSICHIDLDNDLGGENVYLDNPCDDRNVTEDDELPELVTPVSFSIDDPTYTSNQQHFLSYSTPQMRTHNFLSYSTSQLCDDTIEDYELEFRSTRPRAMTLPAGSVSQFNSQDDNTIDSTSISQGGDLFIPSLASRVHHTLHRKKSMFDLRHEFRRRPSTRGGTSIG